VYKLILADAKNTYQQIQTKLVSAIYHHLINFLTNIEFIAKH